MRDSASDTSLVTRARIAGLLGLTILALGTFAGFVHGRLVVPGDAATTASNIMASESLFRLGFVSGLAMYTVFIFYALVLYKLFKRVDENHAALMLVLALLGVPIALLNQANQSSVLLLLSGAEYLQALPPDQLYARVMLSLRSHVHGGLIGGIFWGLWLFPLGWLVYRSGYLPRILGVLLMIGCFGWLILVLQRFLLPDYEALGYSRFAAHIAELAFILWLLIKGADSDGREEMVLESS